MKKLFTIGHSSHTTEYFLELLNIYSINCIIDIRSVPYSKYVPQYNKDVIKKILQAKGIYCLYMGVELGILQKDKEFFSDGYLDFEKVSRGKLFKEAFRRIEEGIKKNYIIAIMCTEKDPIDCHRSILVGRVFHENGYEVNHILPEGTLETHSQFEERLVNLYFRNELQESFFHIPYSNDMQDQTIIMAYHRRNQDLVKKL